MATLTTRAVRAPSRSNQTVESLREALVESRGASNRRRILRAIDERPRNANRLAETLSLDYKTVRYHLSVLEAAGAVTRGGDRYGAVYLLTAGARRHWDVVERVERDTD